MSKEKEWKMATKQYVESKGSNQNFSRRFEQYSGIIKIVKWLIVGIFLIFFLMTLIKPSLTMYKSARTDAFKKIDLEVEEIEVKTNAFDNGFYIYKAKNLPGLEIHALSVASKDIFKEDSVSKLTKYYFEKWEDKEKNTIKVEEKYEDCEYSGTKKEDWLLSYKLYIEVNSYQDMLDATEVIIRFRNYMNNFKVILPCYIKLKDNMIQVNTASYQIDKQIRDNVKREYENLTDVNGSKNTEILNMLKLY